MSLHESQSLLTNMTGRDNNQRVIEERLGQHAHCHGDQVVKFGQTHGQQRYRCKSCLRTFIALTGTPFVYLHDKSKLLEQAACMAEGLTIRKSAERVGLTGIVRFDGDTASWRICNSKSRPD
ncbi:hypothetical protein ACFS07_32350 [Undibacterium arcticum]|uniref:Transposase n=2 Tax=Undibacterium arcticum TaxID=1762892 RepID=A0ABV7F3Q4_9BURK